MSGTLPACRDSGRRGLGEEVGPLYDRVLSRHTVYSIW
jgi:hypothetical protein